MRNIVGSSIAYETKAYREQERRGEWAPFIRDLDNR
jgi:hypothetical protein